MALLAMQMLKLDDVARRHLYDYDILFVTLKRGFSNSELIQGKLIVEEEFMGKKKLQAAVGSSRSENGHISHLKIKIFGKLVAKCTINPILT